MEKTIQLYTYQKNTDLHCLSAFATMKEFLNCDSLIKCRRFVLWDMVADCDSETKLVDTIITKSYYLLNTNKEDYYIKTIPLTSKENVHHVNVIVKSKIETQYNKIISNVNSKCNVNIKQLKRAIVWNLTVAASSYQEAEEYVSIQLLGESNKKHPLLLNPIFETYELAKI
ncbi:hypothetical protein DID76_00515 [Candidatus Marinamargulisbacteria bacterium SCGC AG-414-C22]|nr:hypothetical protein DID76_00515 [Candidatus Marinamargulisbacteria bacterium SCGC AG-414-C22]